MALEILQVEYFNITVEDQITSASALLDTIAGAGADFHAFKQIPVEPRQTQFTLFAKDSSKITEGAQKAGLKFDGPFPAIMIKGDEKAGALAGIYKKLANAGIRVDEACGIADVNAGYGVILYIHKENIGKALAALEM